MTQTQFEDRLLVELRQVVAARAVTELPAAPRPRRRLPVLFAGTATAGVAAGAFLFAFGSGQAPAFAVEPHSDGNVTVRINRLSDAQGLESQLRAAGISAVVNYTPFGKTCREPRGRPAAPPNGQAGLSGMSVNGGSTTFTVTRNLVGSGQTLVITTSGGNGPSSVGMEVIQGPVSPCELVNAPALPPGASHSTHGPVGGGAESGFGTGYAPKVESHRSGG